MGYNEDLIPIPQDTDWLDRDNDKCPIPDRGETDTSDEVRDLNEL